MDNNLHRQSAWVNSGTKMYSSRDAGLKTKDLDIDRDDNAKNAGRVDSKDIWRVNNG